MADPRGFLTTPRETPARRPVALRLKDWREVYEDFPADHLADQAGRCMNCGIPFCHSQCPLGNIIPEWNDLAWRDDWKTASDRLHATNNFPEFTGRLCPAPCESACVLGINQDPVTIKQIEVTIVERAWKEGWLQPRPPERLSGKTVAVIGSGPAGLAVAQQLARAGHTVAVFERADRIGGLLRYGIPEFKMEKRFLERRLAQLEAEGVRFRPGVDVGHDVSAADIRARYDAVVLTVGATSARDLPIPGRDALGVHQAMEYLPQANRFTHGDYPQPPIHVGGKHVVIIGGGDTGADCLGTAHRQGAASVTQLEIMPRPSEDRPANMPWPTFPLTYKVTSAHEEGGERVYAVQTQEFLKTEDGRVRALVISDVEFEKGAFVEVPGTRRELPADFVFLAMGFTGVDRGLMVDQLGVDMDARGNIARDAEYATSVPGVFVAGDAGRGQSLIVWAIAEGRAAAASVDRFLMGTTGLPSPITPTTRSMTA